MRIKIAVPFRVFVSYGATTSLYSFMPSVVVPIIIHTKPININRHPTDKPIMEPLLFVEIKIPINIKIVESAILKYLLLTIRKS